MLISDYIVQFLIEKEITDVFGYPGGMVTYLMDAFSKRSDKIGSHLCYHEQAAAFAACGYAQVSNKPGIAFATSGPGATNLITGIANSYFDSIPSIFFTGQVNTYEQKGTLSVRQKGFQETDLIGMMKDITKYVVKIEHAKDIRYELEKAYHICMSGRPGPVVLDIPMNIQRTDVNVLELKSFIELNENTFDYNQISKEIITRISEAKRPLIIAGAGIRTAGMREVFKDLVENLKIPVVTSMIGIDALPSDSAYNMGFIGAYGHRHANFLIAKSDLIITLGSRLDCRQTGTDQSKFAEQAQILRIDIDQGEMSNRINEREIQYQCDLKGLIPTLLEDPSLNTLNSQEQWLNVCIALKEALIEKNSQYSNNIIRKISEIIPDNTIITTDVGQNQVWVAQSFVVKALQKVVFSGGHGAMGYSLPASIGAYYAHMGPVISISGDGGFQMNIQELQMIAREKLPIKIIIVNNKSLGMIRHFQEMYFDSNDVQTVEGHGYSAVNFEKIAKAYGISYDAILSDTSLEDLKSKIDDQEPRIFEVVLNHPTYVFPKLSMGNPFYNQDPLLDEEFIAKLMNL